MSMQHNGLKTKDEYLEAYPDRRWLWELPKVKDSNGRRCVRLFCEDKNCLNPEEEHLVILGHLSRDRCGDGLYRCKDCAHRFRVSEIGTNGFIEAHKKHDESLGLEGRKKSSSKRLETMGPDGIRSATEKACKTRAEKGTDFRNMVESLIDDSFGSVHVRGSWRDEVPGFGVGSRYEIDCYFPELKLGIEIDEWKNHCEGRVLPIGYHYNKDKYFREEFGIEIYHIPEHHKGELYTDWCLGVLQDTVRSIIDGSYDKPRIDVEDPVYGAIIYSSV